MLGLPRVGCMLLLMLTSASVFGQSQNIYQFDSGEQEQRFQSLTAELRCPKCQNQNIADSDAPISKDMREAVHRMMADGASDEDITNALVARFGEFVRYKPEIDRRTIMLWATPAIVVFIGVLVVAVTVRRSGRSGANDQPLTDAERARAAELLNNQDKSGGSS